MADRRSPRSSADVPVARSQRVPSSSHWPASLVATTSVRTRTWSANGRATRTWLRRVNPSPRGGRLDLDELSRYLRAARGLVVIPDDVGAATRLAGGNFHWRDAPASWQRAVRELAVALVSDWARLGLSSNGRALS